MKKQKKFFRDIGKIFKKFIFSVKNPLTRVLGFAIILNCIIIAVVPTFGLCGKVRIKTIIYAYARILAAQM